VAKSSVADGNEGDKILSWSLVGKVVKVGRGAAFLDPVADLEDFGLETTGRATLELASESRNR
jgi:hypothetical protein